MITTVTGKNQVTIPAELARELNIKAGTQLDWCKQEDGTMLVKPLPSRGEIARRLAGIGQTWLRPGDNPVADLVRERAADDEAHG
jgi:AbrB family looped-hinge helix DNA binding protein